MKGRGLAIALVLAVALLAVACVVPVATPTPAPTPTPTPTRTPTPTPTPSPTPTATPAASTTQVQYLGHSAFLLTSSQGTKVLVDPPSAGTGYGIAPIAGVDAVPVTHEHSDHNNVALATGSPLILRGLTSDGWATIDQRVKDVRIFSISPANPIYHDAEQGARRGRNTIFVLEVDGLRLAHLGDLGHTLTPQAVQAIGAVDVVMIPVGGNFTIDAAAATQVVGQLSPRVVIPMHYKTDVRPTWQGEAVDPFLVGKTVQRPNSTTIDLSKATLPAATTVVVLNYAATPIPPTPTPTRTPTPTPTP